MPASTFTWVVSAIFFCLCPAMLFLIFRQKLYRRLVFFTAYLVLLLIWNILLWRIAPTPFFYTHAWLLIYLSTEFGLSILRLLTIAEISRRFLRAYPAIWALAAWLLSSVAAGLLLWTTNSAIHNAHHFRRFVLLGDQRFEFMQAALLLTLLMIGAYYRIQIPPLYRLILIGIGIYSSIQVANNELAIHISILTNSIFDYTRRGAIMVSVVIWTHAVWHYHRVPESQPPLISQATYDDLSPQVHDRLRELNDKLSKLIKR